MSFRTTGLALFLGVLLIPAPDHPPPRDMNRDIAGLRQAECNYRGITATFEELTRAYVLQTYEEGELIRWQATPSPRNPDFESLVTAVFSVARAKPFDERELSAQAVAVRRQVPPSIQVTWRYSTLAAVRVTAANQYAADAIAVYCRTVEDFIDRMVFTVLPTTLRQGPGAGFPAVEEVEAGTVLLLQPSIEDQEIPDSWRYVRIPSSTVIGWIAAEDLRAIEHDR